MENLIQMLHLEDDPADAELVQAKLAEADLACRITRAQTRDEFESALRKNETDIILADFRLPTYDGMSALRLAKELRPDVPFIFVSGTMGEEAAIEGLTQGATDYLLKENLSRLASAVQRALQEAWNKRERRQAQEALQRSNEMLRAIIEAAPVAIIGLDLEGRVHSVWNPAAEKMLGWSEQEVMGRFLPTVPTESQEEFRGFREQIRRGMTLDGVDVRRQRRDCTPIDYSIYASPLYDADGRISGNIAVLVDVTERRRSSTINAARLRLMQFAATHSLDELLEEAINEAEKETESLIGFYAFIDEDQQSLTLQNWSTRTKSQFCKAEGKGLHHLIADAGIWVDCFHQRRPVIHNDYRSLAHRKGLPEGHAELARELVVPVLRGEKVKAILGVGNKPSDYTEKDVEAMSLLADIIWEITERKLAEQQVAQMSFALNGIHEAAFMVDEHACLKYVNEEACRILGYSRDELLTMTVPDVSSEYSIAHWPVNWSDLKEQGASTVERQITTRDGRVVPLEINVNYFEYEGRSYALGLARDITESKQAERERLANLRFFECMDRVNRAIQGADDLEAMMRDLLDVVLSIFDSDRAFLTYPCDPESPTWHVPMERNKTDYPDFCDLGSQMPMDPQIAETLRILLNSDGPVKFGPGYGCQLPTDVSERFQLKSCMSMALFPRVGKPWQFGIHQCSHPRVWTAEEERLLQEIGRRLEDGLTSMLAYRNLRESEEQYRRIVDTASEGIWVIGPDTLTTFVNARMAQMLGCSGIEMIGRPVTDFMFEEDVPDHVRKMENRRQGMQEFYERRFRHKDGRTVWTHVSASSIFDAGHHFIGSFGMFMDITEQKRVETQLNAQLHFLQQLLDSIPIPVFYKDREGLYLGCNAAFEAFTGLQRKAIVGKTVHQVVPEERVDIHHEADLALLGQPGVQTYEVSGTFKDGKHHDVIFNKASFVDANDCVAGTVGAMMDITERKQAERERLGNLRFFESIDRVNRAIQCADNLEAMMRDLLDVVLSIFDCDRAFLMYPCDPEAPTLFSPMEMERNKPEYPGVRHLQREIPMDPQVAEALRVLLAADGPVTFGPGTPHVLPEDVSEQFNIKSCMSMAVYPKVGSPWQFGIQQCDSARIWKAEEMRMFEAIGRRLTDGLTSLLSYRDLRQNEEFLDNVVEHIPDMIFVKDAQDLRFVRLNQAGERLLGYAREEMLGKTDYDFFPKKMADFFTTKDRQALDAKDLVDIPEETIQNRSNEKRLLHTKKIPILDETGAPQYLLGISEDITERKQAEAAIRKLSQAIEQSPVSIVITDVEGRIEFVNSKFTQITGYSFAEALGQNPRILKSGETPAEEYRRLWQTISSGGVWQGEFHNRKKNGELFWEQATIAPVRDADNAITHYVAVKEDITERKKLEVQFRQVQKLEAIGLLAGGIAHDFNNILSAITGYTEISQSIIEPDSPVAEYLAHVLEAGGRARELINQIMMFSRETEQELRPIRVALPVKEALKLIRASVPATIEIHSEILSQASALADPTQVHQIVMNLCTNAAHAMQGKGGILQVRLTDISIDHGDHRQNYPDAEPGEYIRLTVSDQGHGIDTLHLHRIFDPFFTTKEKGEGTGMGLSVVHGIVKSYNGLIYVHSRLGGGSTFDILIPALKSTVQDKIAMQKPVPTGSEHILFVDDEEMIVDIAKGMLESLGYRVAARTSPIEALEAFRNNPDGFDLVVTDLMMPKMTGLELMEKIRRIRPGLPVVLCTGFGVSMNEEQIIRRGVRHLIYKPILRRDMATAVRDALDGTDGQ